MRWLKSLFGRKRDVAPAPEPVAIPPAAPAPAPIEAPDEAAAPGVPMAPRFPADVEPDATQTERLATLLSLPAGERDAGWLARFHVAVWHAALDMPWDAPVEGPDGFSYLRLDLPPAGMAFEGRALGELAAQCVRGGFGAAIYADGADPVERAAFVFSMGRLDSMLRYDDAEGDPLDRAPSADGDVMVSAPSRTLLPGVSARPIFGLLVDGWGFDDPGVALIDDPAATPSRSLVLSIAADELPAGLPQDEALALLGWFLPPGRALMFRPAGFEAAHFVPLAQFLED